MYSLPVEGEIKTIASRQGSSGVFTGTIQGLYQGYRFGSTVPDEQERTIELDNGSLAFTIRQQIMTMLQDRPEVHPFADGRDPFEEIPVAKEWVPEVYGGPKVQLPAPPNFGSGNYDVRKTHYIEVTCTVDPDQSTGIFAGATGQFEIECPQYRMAGDIEIETDNGKLHLKFMEAAEEMLLLAADLWVDGDASTGMWKGAEGELKFRVSLMPPMFGRGPYSGTIRLQNPPPDAS